MSKRVGGGSQRVLEKLKQSVANGDFYEAHQMYRTLYFRYVNSSEYVLAENLLFDGALTFLLKNVYSSGVDLASLLIDVYTKSKCECTSEKVEKIKQLLPLIPSSYVEKQELITKVLQWSKSKEHPRGFPELHTELALMYEAEGVLFTARYHFILSSDPVACANFIIRLSENGVNSEIDLFCAQAVFQYLILKQIVSAREFFRTYVSMHPKVAHIFPFQFPLLNFLYFILHLANNPEVSEVYLYLCEKYKATLSRDPTFQDSLPRIGEQCFGIPQVKKPVGGFQSLIESFFGNEDMEDSDICDAQMAVVVDDLD